MVAAPHTGNVVDRQFVFSHALESLLQLSLQGRRAAQMAAHVIADLDRNSGGRPKIEMGIITRDGVYVAQGQVAAGGDSLQFLSRKVFKLPLNVFEFLEYAIRLMLNG